MFRFTDRSKELYKLTDFVPEDDPNFQGLLEDDGAPIPDVSAELTGVPLEEEESDFQVVTDKPEPDFEDLAAVVLDNTGIGTADQLCAARVAAEAAAAAPLWPQQDSPCLIEADPGKIVYEIVMELPDVGLLPGLVPNAPNKVPGALDKPIDPPPNNDTTPQRYPARSHRSVVGNQPYDTYAPRTQFLQLGEVRAHRSALLAAQEQREQRELPNSNRAELMHTAMSSDLDVDDTVHDIDPELHTTSKDEIAVRGYLMTQYNLKPGLRKFGK